TFLATTFMRLCIVGSLVFAATMKFIISFICGTYIASIISYCGNCLLNFGRVGSGVIVFNCERFGFGIPICFTNPGSLRRFFNFGFAHAAIPGDRNGFSLCLLGQSSGRKR